MALLLLLGLLANLTVIGSVEPLGIVPFSSWMALSASMRWSNLMNPTPLDRPARTIGVTLLAPAVTLGQSPSIERVPVHDKYTSAMI